MGHWIKWSLGLDYSCFPGYWPCCLLPLPSVHPILLERCYWCLWLLRFWLKAVFGLPDRPKLCRCRSPGLALQTFPSKCKQTAQESATTLGFQDTRLPASFESRMAGVDLAETKHGVVGELGSSAVQWQVPILFPCLVHRLALLRQLLHPAFGRAPDTDSKWQVTRFFFFFGLTPAGQTTLNTHIKVQGAVLAVPCAARKLLSSPLPVKAVCDSAGFSLSPQPKQLL